MHPSIASLGAAALLLAPGIQAQDAQRVAPGLGLSVVPIHTAPAEEDGTPYGVWAVGRDYKVSFHDGFTFIPYLGDAVRENVTLRWRTLSVTAGGQPVADVMGAPETAHGSYRYEYRWGDLVEAYDVRAEGVEQTFVLRRRPAADGDLVITGALQSDLRVAPALVAAHGPVALCDAQARTVLEYGAAFAVDANGSRLALATEARVDGTVVLRVPQDWLRAAAFPLTIDPLVRTLLRSLPIASALVQTDIGRDDRVNQLLIAYERKASATDSDLFLDLYDDDFNMIANVFTDVTGLWSTPAAAIAHVGGADRWVTVLERKFSDGRSGVRINIRDSGATAVDNNVLVLSRAAGESHLRPDIGGIASGSTGNNALVVCEQVTSASTTREVLGFAVDAANETFGTRHVMAGFGHGTTIDRRFPAVNQESLGPNDGWLVAYQEQNLAQSNDDIDVLLVRVGFDGALLTTIRNGTAFAGLNAHKMGPKVAGRDGKYMIAFSMDERATRPLSPATPEGTSIVLQAYRWPANGGGLDGEHLRRHVRTSPQWVIDDLAYDTGTRTFWACVFHNVSTGDCSISRHGFDAGEVFKGFLAEPALGETGFGGSVCFDDDDGVFKATLVRNRGTGSELVGAVLGYAAATPVTFGTSCGGRIGTGGTPLAGSDSFRFTLAQATPSAPAMLIVSTSPAAVPLDPIGMPGCMLNATIGGGSVTVNVPISSFGSADVPLPLPANPVALTGRLVAQFLYFAPGANSLGALATGGVDVNILR